MLDKLPARDHVVIATIEVVHRFQSPLCRDLWPARACRSLGLNVTVAPDCRPPPSRRSPMPKFDRFWSASLDRSRSDVVDTTKPSGNPQLLRQNCDQPPEDRRPRPT